MEEYFMPAAVKQNSKRPPANGDEYWTDGKLIGKIVWVSECQVEVEFFDGRENEIKSISSLMEVPELNVIVEGADDEE